MAGHAPAPSAPLASLPEGEPCPLCGSSHRVLESASLEEHCAECGLVFTDAQLVAPGPLPSEASSPNRGGRGIGPFVPPGTGRRLLGSTLNARRDGQGKPLSWHRRYEFEHLKRVMQRQTARATDGPLDRSMARAALAQCAERLSLPPVVLTEAERIFREAKNAGAFRGRNLPSCVGATIYAACRRFMLPRTLGEVARASGARRAEVGRAFKVVQRHIRTPIPSTGTKAFLHRYAAELALSAPVRSSVEEMLDEAYQNPELSGISPHGLVAALIYLASERHGERRSRAQVARVSAVTEVTLRSTSRLVERLMGRRGSDGPPASTTS
jgi:transcription initiation factor TFIIB